MCNYKSLKDENKIITKFLTEGKEYFDYLINSEGKIALTATERTTFNGIVDSVKEKTLLWESLFLTQNVEKEKEVFWTEQAKYGEVKCKAKMMFSLEISNLLVIIRMILNHLENGNG